MIYFIIKFLFSLALFVLAGRWKTLPCNISKVYFLQTTLYIRGDGRVGLDHTSVGVNKYCFSEINSLFKRKAELFRGKKRLTKFFSVAETVEKKDSKWLKCPKNTNRQGKSNLIDLHPCNWFPFSDLEIYIFISRIEYKSFYIVFQTIIKTQFSNQLI